MEDSNDAPVRLGMDTTQMSAGEPAIHRPSSRFGAYAGSGLARPAKRFVRFLYTSNPFYILSADLVFIGLRMSYGPGGRAAHTWALAMSLAAYTLLLATTACILIRFGRLWDDLRSLLVLVVMMFLAIATSFDDTMAADPGKGAVGCVVGLLFAVVVTEAVLHTIRLRLPGRYRLSYYLILGLIFVYPAAISPLMGDPDNSALQWALFGFAPMAGLALASLVPAARLGRSYLAKNGSPWRWPLYPWTLFVVLAAGLCVRSYSLCVSFHYVEGSRTIFGPYFLVPIGLAVSWVWLELGIASGRRGIMFASSVTPLGLVYLSTIVPRDDFVFQQFLETFTRTLGTSPFYLSLLAAIVFLAYAESRGVPAAREFLAAGLMALSFIGPRSITIEDLVPVRAWPMVAAGLLLATLAWRHRGSWRAWFAAGCLVTGLTRSLTDVWPAAPAGLIGLHLAVASLLLIGAVFDDAPGRLARRAGAPVLLLLGITSAINDPRSWASLPQDLAAAYPILVASTAWTYAYIVHDRLYLACAAATLAAWLAFFGGQAYVQYRKVVVGLDQIACGLAFFVIAMAISLRKAGLWPRNVPRWLAPIIAGWNHPRWVGSAGPRGQTGNQGLDI